MITKKHFIRIAELFKVHDGSFDDRNIEHFHNFRDNLCQVFLEDNPLFDEERFIEACTPAD